MDAASETAEPQDRLRERLLAGVPALYSPWLHLAVPSLVGLLAVAVAIGTVDDVDPHDVGFVALTVVLANACEWRAHKSLLHQRVRGLELMFDRHTPLHHALYRGEDLAMRDRREFMFVLIPAWGILVILGVTLPITLALALSGATDLAALFVATCAMYVVTYEWMHLAYHLPPDGPIGRLPPIRWLRRHHATHHRPALMQRWNFNVTLPLWDWVRGTIYRA